MAQTFSTDESDWQGVDDEPTVGGNNLVKSGGIWKNSQVAKTEFYQNHLVLIETEFGYYYNTSVGVGNVVGDKIASISPDVSCVMAECSPFDTFFINGTGGNAARLYAFLDSDKKIIRADFTSVTRTNRVIIAPPNSAYIVANFTVRGGFLMKGYNDIDDLNKQINGTLITTSYSAGSTVQYKFVAGKKYLLQWVSGGSVVLSLRNQDESTSVQSIGTIKNSNNTILFTADVNCSGLRYGSNTPPVVFLLSEEGSVPYQIYQNNIPFDSEPIAESKNLVNSGNIYKAIKKSGLDDTDVFTFTTVSYAKNYATPYPIKAGDVYLIEVLDGSGKVQISTYDTTEGAVVEGSFVTLNTNYPQIRYTFIPTADADAFRHGAGWSAGITIRISRLNNQIFINEQLKRLDVYSPMVTFDVTHDVIDVSDYMEDVDFTTYIGGNYLKFPTDLFAKFDALVAAHPNDIEKIDAAEMVNIAYPNYTSLNGSASGDYLATPSYKEWMFKISSPRYYGGGTQNDKKVLLLVAGTHGNERGAQFNSYVFARRLCEDYLEDINLFKLRMAFDIYIIPILDVYGSYHSTRTNANGVNINRSYYIGTSGTSLHPFDPDYPGETGCGEFETQLIVALSEELHPFVGIDHHSNIDEPFYSAIQKQSYIKAAFNALADVSFAIKRAFPSIFGSDCSILKSNSAPFNLGGAANTTARWWTYNGATEQDIVPFAATIEIDQGVNYSGGNYVGAATDVFSVTALSVAEYVLRAQLLRYCEEALGQEKRIPLKRYTTKDFY